MGEIKIAFDKALNKLSWRFIIPKLAEKRRKKLKATDFTIISNNCWGGRVYEYFNLQKQSPTVGLYFFSEDYVKFCSNLKYYLSQDLILISSDSSAHKEELHQKGEDGVIVGKLDDVEIIFLHYHDSKIILEKWNRRLKRINWDRIILKFSYQNNCSDELIKSFMLIEAYPKICFVGEPIDGQEGIYLFPRHKGKETIDETENIDRFFNIADLINSKL